MNRNELKNIIEAILLIMALMSWVNSLINWLQSDDLWFSWFVVFIVCIGMWYIGEKAGSQKS